MLEGTMGWIAGITAFGTAALLITALITFMRQTATTETAGSVTAISAILVAWGLGAAAFGLSFEIGFAVFAPFAIVPIVAVTALAFRSPLRDILAVIPVHWLVFAQFYRIAGGLFLVLYYEYDVLPRGFALNAGWGDVLTGVLALPVGYMAMKRLPGFQMAIVAWCAIGIGDLILAPYSAYVYGGGRVNDFPINIVPLFLGPPLGILLHVFTLRTLWLRGRIAAAPAAVSSV